MPIEKGDPVSISSILDKRATFLKVDTGNKFTIGNQTLSIGGPGSAIAATNSPASNLSVGGTLSDFAFGEGNYAIAFWIYATSGGPEAWFLRLLSSADMYISLRLSGGDFYLSTYVLGAFQGQTAVFSANAWHCIVIERQGIGVSQLRYWVDDVENAANRGTNSANITSVTNLTIVSNTTFPSLCKCDEFKIYNRTLSAAEKTAFYNAGNGVYGVPESGLVAGWRFDEGGGTNASDYSGNAHNATLSNAGWTTGIVSGTGTEEAREIIEHKNGELSGETAINTFNPDTNARGVINGKTIRMNIAGVQKLIMDSLGRIGLGVASPLAYLHLSAGTATAGTAPLKFTSGTVMTTPEAGAAEYNGTDWFVTIGTTRYVLVRAAAALTAGRVSYNEAGGIQADSANLLFDGTNLTCLGTVAGTNIPTLASGVYTPTLTNVANLDSSAAHPCKYIRIGSIVTVTGMVDIDPVSVGVVAQIAITLPIASNLGSYEDLQGVATNYSPIETGMFYGDTTNDRADLYFLANSAVNHSISFTFTYKII